MTSDDDRYEDRMFWRSASPYMRLLGVKVPPPKGGTVTMMLAANDRIARSQECRTQHPLVLSGLADDCLSFAIGHLLPIDVGILTLDMWLSFAPRCPDGSTITAHAVETSRTDDVATAQIHIADLGGTLLRGTGTFLTGRYPSGKQGDRESAGRFDVSSVDGPYARATGLHLEPNGAEFSGASGAVIGWEAGPAVHGGATAALLQAACNQARPEGQQIRALHIRYLRPAIGSFLRADAQPDVAGSRASHLSGRARSAGGAVVATCAAVFAPPASDVTCFPKLYQS